MFATDMATAPEWEKCKLSACCSIDGTACSVYLANVTAEGYCLRIEENSMPMPHLQLQEHLHQGDQHKVRGGLAEVMLTKALLCLEVERNVWRFNRILGPTKKVGCSHVCFIPELPLMSGYFSQDQ